MTTDVQRRATVAIAPVPLTRRLFGLGSVFGKTIRDSRRAVLLAGFGMGLLLIGVSQAIVTEFATAASRQELANIVNSVPPILQGLAGKPVNVETLGGYLSYKYGSFFPIIVGLWSIVALSGTLATEARRGSLEFVAANPLRRRTIALEKLGGHIVGMVIACFIVSISLVVVGSTISGLPGDEISVTAAAGYALWLGLLGLVAGSVAFAIAPFLGRGAATGFATAILFGGFLLNGYQSAIPQLAPLANLTWFGWTTNHIPLAGVYDWASLGLVAVVAVVLFAIGTEAFVRRDLAATSAVPTPSLPRALVGLRGPASRATGEILPSALAWGIGIGIFGLLIAGSGRSFVEQLASSPDFSKLLASIFPGHDVGTVGGFLQLLFLQFGLIFAGLAAATLVGNWASDETSGRLELLLAAPFRRTRWVVAGGIGVLVGIVVIVVVAAIGISIGASITGGDITTPVVGTLALGLFAVGMAGIGFAVGGLFGTRFAGPVVAVVTIVTWFLDTIGASLGLPDTVRALALSTHLGQPMLGVWDPVGIAACLILAIGGVGLGAWGFARRDMRS
jgi:ABC-2 type transport system permease protein